MKVITTAFFIVLMVMVSCQKEISSDGQPGDEQTTATDCRLTKMVQGTGIDDSVFIIKYDAQSRITAVIDSVNTDTFSVSYDAVSGNLKEITDSRGSKKRFTYNTAGRPTGAVSTGNKVTLEYADDTVLTKVTEYANNGTTWDMWRYYELQYDSKNNLVKVKGFDAANKQVNQVTYTYSDILNSIRPLTLFNFENYLGLEDILPESVFHLYAGKYLIKSYSQTDGSGNGGYTADLHYELDKAKKLISSKATFKDRVTNAVTNVLTRKYLYECK